MVVSEIMMLKIALKLCQLALTDSFIILNQNRIKDNPCFFNLVNSYIIISEHVKKCTTKIGFPIPKHPSQK